jgi:hypothetical protein
MADEISKVSPGVRRSEGLFNRSQGDNVSWKWGAGHPEGKVADIVTEGKAQVTSKKGNVISKNASEDDPAVVIERDGVSGAGTTTVAHEWLRLAGLHSLTRRMTR